MSRVLGLVVLASLVGLGSGCGRTPSSEGSRPAAPPAVEVEVAGVRTEDLPRLLSTVGTFRAVTEAQVSPRASGVVVQVPVALGQRVTRGQVLLQQDSTEARLQIGIDQAQIQADLAKLGGADGARRPDAEAPTVRKAAAALENARLEWERSQNLYRANLIAETELQTAKKTFLAAQADVQSALETVRATRADVEVRRSSLRMDEQKLEDLTTRAPFDGYLSLVSVAAGDNVTPGGGPYLRLTQLDPIDCRLNIAQVEASRLRVGQPVQVRTEAWPGRVFPGKVVHINPTLDAQTRTLQVDARLSNPSGALRPGFFGTVELQVGMRRNALLVPQASVIRAVGGSQVFVVEGSSVRAVRVETGESRGAWFVLDSGELQAGQRLAVHGLDRLYDGAPVTVKGTVSTPPAPAGGG